MANPLPAGLRGSTARDAARARILDAASALFAQRGYEGASTRAIAERAGAHQALIRYHFGGKEPLWREVIERGLRALAGSVSAALVAGSDRVAALLAALAAHPQTVHAIVHALLEPGPRRDFLLQRLAPLHARALSWLSGGARVQRSARDELFATLWIAAAAAPAVLGPALQSVSGRMLDAQTVQQLQRDALGPWLRGAPLALGGGAWSLAAAQRRRLSPPR